MLLVKLSLPVPSVVKELVMVGAVVIAQQTPFAVIAALPSEVIFPPETADVKEIAVIATVVKVGTNIGEVVTVISFPYAVPALLVA
jgi:hypothetical protein